MSTTRCKIPLGMFYGHMVVLPGEDYSEFTASETNVNNISDPVLQSTIESQCTILSALAEDVQCRFVHKECNFLSKRLFYINCYITKIIFVDLH